MTNQFLKPILVGLLIGATLYFVPVFFLGKLVFFLILMTFLFGFFRRRRLNGAHAWTYADKIRSMSDDEYADFKKSRGGKCYHHNETTENENHPS